MAEPASISPQPPTELPEPQMLTQTQAQIVAHQAGTTIEAGDESDSLGDQEHGAAHLEYPQDSESIVSSVFNFGFENGRRYHKFREGRYQFPNDESEQAREDMKHAMMASLCGGKLFLAPIEQPRKVLDLGTGTGIWAIDGRAPQSQPYERFILELC